MSDNFDIYGVIPYTFDPSPREELPPLDEKLHTLVRLWDKAVGTPGYDKEEWIKFHTQVLRLVTNKPGGAMKNQEPNQAGVSEPDRECFECGLPWHTHPNRLCDEFVEPSGGEPKVNVAPVLQPKPPNPYTQGKRNIVTCAWPVMATAKYVEAAEVYMNELEAELARVRAGGDNPAQWLVPELSALMATGRLDEPCRCIVKSMIRRLTPKDTPNGE